jgi:hypothetical protein
MNRFSLARAHSLCRCHFTHGVEAFTRNYWLVKGKRLTSLLARQSLYLIEKQDLFTSHSENPVVNTLFLYKISAYDTHYLRKKYELLKIYPYKTISYMT